jgi:hypothetical protein
MVNKCFLLKYLIFVARKIEEEMHILNAIFVGVLEYIIN